MNVLAILAIASVGGATLLIWKPLLAVRLTLLSILAMLTWRLPVLVGGCVAIGAAMLLLRQIFIWLKPLLKSLAENVSKKSFLIWLSIFVPLLILHYGGSLLGMLAIIAWILAMILLVICERAKDGSGA